MATLDIGRTFSRTAGLVGGSMASVGLFVVAVQVITAVEQYFMTQRMMELALASRPTPGNPMAGLAMFSSGWYWGGMGFSLLVGAFAMAGGIGGMLRVASGEEVSLGDCMTMGLQKLLPMLALTLLWMLGLMAGFILLLVPGLILLAMWSVAAPALMAEDGGVFGAFGRSRALTKGSRGKILLLLVIVGILLMVAATLLSAGTGLQSFGRPMAAPVEPFGPGRMLGQFVLGSVFGVVSYALLVSLYVELDDGSGGRLANVFS